MLIKHLSPLLMNGLYVLFCNTRKILYETCFNSTPLLKLCFAKSFNHRKMVFAKDIIYRILT